MFKQVGKLNSSLQPLWLGVQSACTVNATPPGELCRAALLIRAVPAHPLTRATTAMPRLQVCLTATPPRGPAQVHPLSTHYVSSFWEAGFFHALRCGQTRGRAAARCQPRLRPLPPAAAAATSLTLGRPPLARYPFCPSATRLRAGGSGSGCGSAASRRGETDVFGSRASWLRHLRVRGDALSVVLGDWQLASALLVMPHPCLAASAAAAWALQASPTLLCCRPDERVGAGPRAGAERAARAQQASCERYCRYPIAPPPPAAHYARLHAELSAGAGWVCAALLDVRCCLV